MERIESSIYTTVVTMGTRQRARLVNATLAQPLVDSQAAAPFTISATPTGGWKSEERFE